MFRKTVTGRIPGIKVTVEFFDIEIPDGEKLHITRMIQEFADSFDSVEEFETALNDAAKRAGVKFEEMH